MELITDTNSESSTDETSTTTETDEEKCRLNKRLKRNRINNYIEKVVLSYAEQEFFEHFRMSRTLTYSLIDAINVANVLLTHLFGRGKVTSTKAFLLILWYLANQESVRQIADRFNVSLSCAHKLLDKITNYFIQISPEYIYWPQSTQAHIISEGFKRKKGIGGSHISIKKPIKDSEVYINRKGYYSILVQAVVDNQKLFTDIYCGEPGSVHDARLLKKSTLYKKVAENPNIFGNKFLLGDSAYPKLPWLVPPFKDYGNLTPEHKIFNYKHSATRIVIENTFGLLKGRFRRLIHFENLSTPLIVKCVITSCVLHNMCLRNKEATVEPHIEENEMDDMENEEGDGNFGRQEE